MYLLASNTLVDDFKEYERSSILYIKKDSVGFGEYVLKLKIYDTSRRLTKNLQVSSKVFNSSMQLSLHPLKK